MALTGWADAEVVLDIVGILLSLGAAFYLYALAKVLRGGVLERGMTILAISPVLLALSALLDMLSALGFGEAYGFIRDVNRIIFILVFFIGARSIVVAWRKVT